MSGPAARSDFSALYEAHFDFVWNTLRRLGVADAHREDVAHEVFVTAWKKLGDYDPGRPLKPWLFGIAFRLASDFRARAVHQREVSDEGADAVDEARSPEGAVEQSQAQALVRAALAAIPVERRAVFVMHELEGLSIPEVAEAMEIPLNTAASRYRYGLDKLRARLRPIYEEIK